MLLLSLFLLLLLYALQYTSDTVSHLNPVNGGWSNYGEWGDCSVTCGSGVRARTRTCTNPVPSGGGMDCDGSTTQVDMCVLEACSGKTR